MSHTDTPAEDTPPQKRLNVWQLLGAVIVRPRRAFEFLAANGRRTWWLPAVLALLFTILPVVVSAPLQAAQSEQPASPEYMMRGRGMISSASPATNASSANVGGLALRIIGRIVSMGVNWLLWGTALYLASVFLGHSRTFGQMLSLTVWTWLPYAVRGLVQTIYILISKQVIANPGLSGFVIDRRVPSLVPQGPGQIALAAILANLDLYLIWNLVLLIVGLSAMTRLARRQSIIAVLVTWLLLTLLGLIPAMVGNMFSQVGQTFM